MARIRIPKNARRFTVSHSMALTPLVADGESGGCRVNIPRETCEEAGRPCQKLNAKDRPEEIWK